jgi:hypothetical protein
VPDAAPDLSTRSASAPDGDGTSAPARPAAEAPASGDPSGDHRIVPGHYSGPMSMRAAARFAQGRGRQSLAELAGQPRQNRLVVIALVAVALIAAGGVGTALAFRFGHARARPPTPSPTATPAPSTNP